MAVPPHQEPSPRIPQPLPERSRRPTAPTIVMVLAVLLIVALVVLL